MILAIPILILVILFLGWVLVNLTVNALPLFAGVSTALFVAHLGGGLGAASTAGLAAAITVATLGRISFERVQSPTLRLAIALVFALPAAAAAWHAVHGVSVHVVSSPAGRGILEVAAAFLVGSTAWRRIASVAERRPTI